MARETGRAAARALSLCGQGRTVVRKPMAVDRIDGMAGSWELLFCTPPIDASAQEPTDLQAMEGNGRQRPGSQSQPNHLFALCCP